MIRTAAACAVCMHVMRRVCRRVMASACRIPKALSAKLVAYYDYVMNRRIHPQDEEILSGLSGSLRQQACAKSDSVCLHATCVQNIQFRLWEVVTMIWTRQCPVLHTCA